MNDTAKGLGLTDSELDQAFSSSHWGERFPPILTIDQAAELLSIPKGTLYDWSSRGLLRDCARRVGKHHRFARDRLLKKVFNEGFHDER